MQAYSIKIEGKIIRELDTLDVEFVFFGLTPNKYSMIAQSQHMVNYIDSMGVRRKLKPEDAKEVQFKIANSLIRMIAHENTVGLGSLFNRPKYVFLKIMIDDRLKVFEYYYQNNSTSGSGQAGTYEPVNTMTSSYILQKEGAELVYPRENSFKKQMQVYFSDCPTLSQKIAEKEIKYNHLIEAVNYYNSNCTAK